MRRIRAVRPRVSRRALAVGGALSLGALFGASCSPQQITAPLRSFERSGPLAVMCLAGPSSPTGAARPLSACTGLRVERTNVFEDADGAEVPHLYALVTQPTRGEIALVDLTTINDNVVDVDASTPGASFLPVGGQPVDIVATKGGTAAFVAVAEVGHEGIFALPSRELRPCDKVGEAEAGGAGGAPPRGCANAPPRVSSWPSCSLPVAPGELLLVADPRVEGQERASCDEPYAEPVAASDAALDLGLEGQGRQKLVVTLPELGGIAILDAQSLLEGEAGAFEPCVVERFVELPVELPPAPLPPAPPTSGACVAPALAEPLPISVPPARPAGLALAGDRLFVGDRQAPLVHVLRFGGASELATPCEPTLEPPLFATSLSEPTRLVTTSKLAVSEQGTLDGKRFLYAVDGGEGSLMVFDVSDDSTARTPLVRSRAELTPEAAPDRVRFSAPVSDVLLLDRDVVEENPKSGLSNGGVRCDPDPELVACDSDASSCDDATLYRTSSSYDDGAGPTRLRGSFALAVLTTGQLGFIDVDDLDARCRVPGQLDAWRGCPPEGWPDAPSASVTLASSDEASCRTVVPHAPRSATYVVTNDQTTGRREPGIVSFPLLYARDGTLVQPGDDVPALVATQPEGGGALSLSVGGEHYDIGATGTISVDGSPKPTLAMNLEDPRAHVSDQAWSLVYEGSLPAFSGRKGRLSLVAGTSELVDVGARFCNGGVESRAAVRAALEASGEVVDLDAEADRLADFANITSALAEEDDAYWDGAACTYDDCASTFGTPLEPSPARELRVLEAYQERLVVEPAVDQALLGCCFPTLVDYSVRAGGQWIALGSSSGFLHHVIADPESGVCRPSCDPLSERLVGRARQAPAGPVAEGSVYAFKNPMFRLAVVGPVAAGRDTSFFFTTQGAFVPLVLGLSPDGAPIIPADTTYVRSTSTLAVSDGLFEGLVLFDVTSLRIANRYF